MYVCICVLRILEFPICGFTINSKTKSTKIKEEAKKRININ